MIPLLLTTLVLSPLLAAASTRQRFSPPPQPMLIQNQARKTQIQRLADSFASVELLGDDKDRKEIPIDPLLGACREMVSVLHKTGPKAVAQDFQNNLSKVEALCTRNEQRQQRFASSDTLTLSSLLKKERDMGIHLNTVSDDGGRLLSDPSGAMGLLWIRRSLAFQLDFFDHLSLGKEPRTAALRAYQAQLQPYHGWALRNANRVLLKSHMPNASSTLLAKIGGYDDSNRNIKQEEKATVEALRRLVSTWRPLLENWKQSFVDLGLEDTRRV